MSFDCDKCGFQNNEIQSGGRVSEKGVRIKLTVTKSEDLNRQVVKSDHTSVKIPELDFEIPAQSQKGGTGIEIIQEKITRNICKQIIFIFFILEVTTIEGIIDRSITGLQQDQSKRREENPETAAEIDLFIAKLQNLKILDEPFTIIFEDITGECHVENPMAPAKDKDCVVTWFKRSDEENRRIGIYPENEDSLLKPIKEGEFTLEQIESEVLQFPTNCPNCNSPCQTNMKLTSTYSLKTYYFVVFWLFH